jgi:hypothetical protein
MSGIRVPPKLNIGKRPGQYGPSVTARDPIAKQPADVDPWMELQRRAGGPATFPPSFKKGGKVKRTGLAKLHKGEKVVAAAKQATAARQRPASRRHSALENIGKKTTPRKAVTPKRVAKPIVRKPAPRR